MKHDDTNVSAVSASCCAGFVAAAVQPSEQADPTPVETLTPGGQAITRKLLTTPSSNKRSFGNTSLPPAWCLEIDDPSTPCTVNDVINNAKYLMKWIGDGLRSYFQSLQRRP